MSDGENTTADEMVALHMDHRYSSPASNTIAYYHHQSGSMECDDNYDVEAELTSLSWLQSLDITSVSSLCTPPCSPSPPPPLPLSVARRHPKKMSPLLKAELGKIIIWWFHLTQFSKSLFCFLDFSENAKKYQMNADVKPPFSYATLICLAMRANSNKLTLSHIYAWIRENFMFYKHADPAWQVRA